MLGTLRHSSFSSSTHSLAYSDLEWMSGEHNPTLLAAVAASLQDLHEKMDNEFATVRVLLAESLKNTAELRLQLANVQRKLDERRTPIEDEKKIDDNSSAGSEASKKPSARKEMVRLQDATLNMMSSGNEAPGAKDAFSTMSTQQEKQDERMEPDHMSSSMTMMEQNHVGDMDANNEHHIPPETQKTQDENMHLGKEVHETTMMEQTEVDMMIDSRSRSPSMTEVTDKTSHRHHGQPLETSTNDSVESALHMSMLKDQHGDVLSDSGKRSPVFTMEQASKQVQLEDIAKHSGDEKMSSSEVPPTEHGPSLSYVSSVSTMTKEAHESSYVPQVLHSDEGSDASKRSWRGRGGLLESGALDDDDSPPTHSEPAVPGSFSTGDNDSTTSSQRRKRQTNSLKTVLEEIPQTRDDLSVSIEEGRKEIASKTHPAIREQSLKSLQPMLPARPPLPSRHEFFGDPHAPVKEFSVDQQKLTIPLTEQLTEHSAFPPSVSDALKAAPIPFAEKKIAAKKRTVRVKDARITTVHGENGIYSGELDIMINQPNGHGTMKYEDGTTYDGEWNQGKWHGMGVAKFPEGDTYQGEFHNDDRHGRGKYTYRDGRAYEGEYVHSKRSGEGIFTWPDGSFYEGSFLDGYRHGQGTYTFSGDGGQYAGEWKLGSYHGFGILFRSDGRRYQGEFQNGQAHGNGTEMMPDGSVSHKGVWIEDQPVQES